MDARFFDGEKYALSGWKWNLRALPLFFSWQNSQTGVQ